MRMRALFAACVAVISVSGPFERASAAAGGPPCTAAAPKCTEWVTIGRGPSRSMIYRSHSLDTRNDGFRFFPTLTRELNPAPGVRLGRIDAPLLGTALASLPAPPKVAFVCGTNAFVEAAASTLLELGLPPAVIRTERYGG